MALIARAALLALLLTGCARRIPYTLAELIQINGEDSAGEFATVETVTLAGRPTHLVTHSAGAHGSCALVVHYRGAVPYVLLERCGSTPNATFEFINGTPVAVLEQSTCEPDYVTGLRYTERYRWTGRRFMFTGRSAPYPAEESHEPE